MKKLISLLLIVAFVLAGCGNQVVTPEPTVVEPTARIEQPTEPHKEEPTEIPTPTEELVEVPTEEPTEEPTPAPLPNHCPSKEFQVAEIEGLSIDLGEHGTYDPVECYDIGSSRFTYCMDLEREDSASIKKLMEEGGSLSFIMPTSGFLYIGSNSTVKVNDELWADQRRIASSPEGNFVVPLGAKVEITTEGGIGEDEYLFRIVFLDSEPIKAENILLPDKSTLSCGELWKISIVNPDSQDVEILIETSYPMVIIDFERLESISYSWGQFNADDVRIGFGAFDGAVIKLNGGGRIEFLLYELLPSREH